MYRGPSEIQTNKAVPPQQKPTMFAVNNKLTPGVLRSADHMTHSPQGLHDQQLDYRVSCLLSLGSLLLLLLVTSADSPDSCRYNQPPPVHIQQPTYKYSMTLRSRRKHVHCKTGFVAHVQQSGTSSKKEMSFTSFGQPARLVACGRASATPLSAISVHRGKCK